MCANWCPCGLVLPASWSATSAMKRFLVWIYHDLYIFGVLPYVLTPEKYMVNIYHLAYFLWGLVAPRSFWIGCKLELFGTPRAWPLEKKGFSPTSSSWGWGCFANTLRFSSHLGYRGGQRVCWIVFATSSGGASSVAREISRSKAWSCLWLVPHMVYE